jgi:hypothetical protein
MAIRRTTGRNAARPASNIVRSGNTEIAPLPPASREPSQQDTPIVKRRPVLQAVALTRDLIANRAQAIWLKRGCPRTRDEENWREAEAQLKTEMGVV